MEVIMEPFIDLNVDHKQSDVKSGRAISHAICPSLGKDHDAFNNS